MEDYKKLRKRALVFDLISLLIAGVVLFFGSRDELQEWVLIAGLCAALLTLVIAIYLSLKARKLECAAFAAENRRLEELAAKMEQTHEASADADNEMPAAEPEGEKED